MQPGQWEQVKNAYADALELPPEERAAFLAKRCAEPEVREEVERMLRAEQAMDDFLERAPFRIPDLAGDLDRQLKPGEVLCGRFYIESFLGRGGMGEVYAARDSDLRESVALKMVRAGFAEDERYIAMLRKEVQRARRIVDVSVCRLYDLFSDTDAAGRKRHFITMELLRGETLHAHVRRRGPLPPAEALALLEQIAAALQAAHGAGIVHGDLKTANVLLVEEPGRPRRAVVTDFGLAREVRRQDTGVSASAPSGSPAGTLAYMSPEQLQGDAPTVEADLYSLGLVTYELIAGELPHGGDNALSAAVKRARSAPPPPSSVAPSTPKSWDEAITRALAPEPKRRFGSPREFLDALRAGSGSGWRRAVPKISRRHAIAAGAVLGVSAAAAVWRPWRPRLHIAGEPSIAVLPFLNLSSDPETEYLSDGITEEVINVLAKIGGLRVISRNSTFRYRGYRPSDLRATARALGAELLMTGSVQRSGGRLRVNVALIDPAVDSEVWSRGYDGDLKDVFRAQDEIAAMVADSLRLQIGRGRLGTGERRTENMAAFDLYLRGRYQAARRDEPGLRAAADLLQQALRADPYYALAHVELGNCYVLMADYGIMPSQEALPRARSALLRSIELEPELADAKAVLGQIYALFDWDWENAENAFGRAIELNRNYALAYHWRAQFRGRLARWPEAIADMREALRLDPVAIPTNTAMGWLCFYHHQFGEAKRQAEHTLTLNPYFVHAHVLRGQAAAHLGLESEAKEAAERAGALASDDLLAKRYTAMIYAPLHMRAEAMEGLRALRREPGSRQAAFTGFLCAYLGLGDETFHWLDLAFETRDPSLPLLKTYPAMDAYRKDARYLDLLRKLKMPSD